MSFRASRLLAGLCLLAPSLASLSSASAQEPAPSLYERRLGIIKGTAKGIVLFGPSKSEQPAPTVPSERKIETGNSEKPFAAAPQAPAQPGLLSALPPPSGRSLAAARLIGAVDGGIAVSTARAASQPQAEPAAKP